MRSFYHDVVRLQVLCLDHHYQSSVPSSGRKGDQGIRKAEGSGILYSWARKRSGELLMKSTSEKPKWMPQDSVWKSENELVDGLFIPPTDPRKVNKLLKKQRKDTTGQTPTITPELKKDLQILKLRSVIDPKRHYKKGLLRRKEKQHLLKNCYLIVPLEITGNAKSKRLRASIKILWGLLSGKTKDGKHGNEPNKGGIEVTVIAQYLLSSQGQPKWL
ncbi:hypothetical protein ACLOJK_012069 [Asimina triloba]